MSRKSVGNKYEYEQSGKLGAGAFAEVFKGKNKITGETVAIKVIKRQLLERYGKDMLDQVHREIGILQQLYTAMKNDMCPFVNKIYECLETTNNIYIVLEFCNGGTLLDYVKKNKKLTEDQAIFILFQLVNALAFMARNNVAHRDIKPENVFIKDGVFKLGDFGFAGQKQLYHTHLGTYPYMAPEFFNSKEYDGNQVDVWALGLLFHEILFGEIYYIGASQYEVTQKILNKKYEIRPEYNASPEVRDLLPRMVEKDGSKRLTAQQILDHPIFNKIKVDQRYLVILEQEKVFWQQFVSQVQITSQEVEKNQQLEEERKKQELLEQIQKEQQRAKIEQQILQIIDGLKDMREAILIQLQIYQFLVNNGIEQTKFSNLYILKQANVKISILKEQLDSYEILTVKDNIKFLQLEENAWRIFFKDDRYTEIVNQLDGDKNFLKKNIVDYYNHCSYIASKDYVEYIQAFQSFQILDNKNYVNEQLYDEQLSINMLAIIQEINKNNSKQFFAIENYRKAIILLYVASQYDRLFNGTLADISRLSQAINMGQAQDIRQIVKFK